jgi:hypothetical protein
VGEVPGDGRVGAAEARGETLAELRPVGVAHDHRRHRRRPAEVVGVEGVEQVVDVLLPEPAVVVAIVDVARRGTDEHEGAEAGGIAVGGEHADHRADRVSDEDNVVQVELLDDVEHVFGVTVEGVVLAAVVCTQVRPTGTDQVEQHHVMVGEEVGYDVPPRLLAAAEAMGEDDRAAGGVPQDGNVVASACIDGIAHGRDHRCSSTAQGLGAIYLIVEQARNSGTPLDERTNHTRVSADCTRIVFRSPSRLTGVCDVDRRTHCRRSSGRRRQG